jgi:peptide chain release factor 1
LQGTHISGKGGLVTDSGGNTTQKGRHLGTGLSETENVVNEEQHILTLLITEVLSNGKTSKSDTGTGSRGLVHLTEDKSDLGLTLKVNDTSLLHLTVQIVTLTGSLTDTGENRETTMGLGNVVNQLLNENGLTDTGTTEETNLTTTGVGGKEIDNLDTSLKNLSGGRLLSEGGGLSVDGKVLSSLNGSTLIDGLTNDVDNSTKGTTADGNGNGGTGVNNGLTTDETLSTVHGNSTDSVLTQMLGNLEDELLTVLSLELKSVKNGGKVVLGKLDIDDSTNDGSIKDSKVSY